jgi:hypothetical protein
LAALATDRRSHLRCLVQLAASAPVAFAPVTLVSLERLDNCGVEVRAEDAEEVAH